VEASAVPTPAKTLPRESGHVLDLGGKVKAIVVTPWARFGESVMFRGDVVLTDEKTADESVTLARL